MDANDNLPAYTEQRIKSRLLHAGASGTVYALVMPESEAALGRTVGAARFDGRSDGHEAYLERFREPWTQKQDAAHEEYLQGWLDWAAPVVDVDGAAFPHRYPTAGASEGIVKLMAEYVASCRTEGRPAAVHVFDGEYEGFSAFARGLGIPVVRHRRSEWRELAKEGHKGQFWISQPSAIDGMVWDDFDAFCRMVDDRRDDGLEVVPDLSYVGAVARPYRFSLDHRCVRSFAVSHSKPFGGYYIRCGGVFARNEHPTLFGNRWFKSLTALAWGVDMMRNHDVHALPRKYRRAQEEACADVAAMLGIEGLEPCDVMVMAKAPPVDGDLLLASLTRGADDDRILRICLTPAMSTAIGMPVAGDRS